jgi:hypothetical protein
MEDLVGGQSQSFAIPIPLVFLPYESKEALESDDIYYTLLDFSSCGWWRRLVQ